MGCCRSSATTLLSDVHISDDLGVLLMLGDGTDLKTFFWKIEMAFFLSEYWIASICSLLCWYQTLRVFHLSYFKYYILQISFNSFQFISSKFWKSVIFNLFEVSFSHFQWNKFLNKFFSEISIITSINTYFISAEYYFLFWVVNGFMISDANYFEIYQLFFFYFEW